jgi:site-specific recombinase XerD
VPAPQGRVVAAGFTSGGHDDTCFRSAARQSTATGQSVSGSAADCDILTAMKMHERHAAAEALLPQFLSHQQAVVGLSDLTLRNYQSSVRNFVAWWHSNRNGDFRAATAGDIEAWLIAESDRGAKPRTRETGLYAMRAFFRWVDRDGVNPAEQVRRPKVPPRTVVPYRPDQARAILDRLAEETSLSAAFDRAVVAMLRWTGVRVAELTGLTVGRLDLERRRAKVIGKGQVPRTVPIPRPGVEVLARYLEEVRPRCPPSAYVFASPRAHPKGRHVGRIDLQGVRELCRRAGVGADVEGPHHPHRWRHSYATELLRAGVDIHVVQRLLGHANLETTTRYLHLVDEDLRAAIDRAYPHSELAPPRLPTVGTQLPSSGALLRRRA